MNLRLRRRDTAGGEDAAALRASRLRDAGLLMAEYELVRTDGRVLAPSDVVREPFRLHDEVCALKREAAARNLHVPSELAALVDRLPTHYRSVGVRVYNPKKAAWKLQLVWAVQLALCAFLVLFFFATLATYWPHIEAQGIDNFAFAYFIDTLLIQAFACEFREILSVVVFNFLMRELLLLFCCLRCSADFRGEGEDAFLTKLARARARKGLARGMTRQLSTLIFGMGKSTFVEEDLLGDEGEAALGEALREAAADHAVVASQLRGAQRTWRLAHPLGEEAQLARLHLDQETPHWRDRRAHRVWRRLRAIEVEALPGASELHAVLDALLAPILPAPITLAAAKPPPPPMAPPPPPPPEEEAPPRRLSLGAVVAQAVRGGASARSSARSDGDDAPRSPPLHSSSKALLREARRQASAACLAELGASEAGADDEAPPPDVAPPPLAVTTRSRSWDLPAGYPPAAGAEADVSRIDMASLELASPHWSAQASAGGARHSSVNEGGGSAEALPAAVSRPLARKLSEMRTAPHEEVDEPAAEVGASAVGGGAGAEAEAAPAEVKAPREAAVEPEKEAAPAAEGSPPLLKPPPVRRVSLVVPAAGATKARPRGAAAGFAARLRRSSAKSSAPRGRTFKAPTTPRSERVGDAPEALPMPGRAVETAGSLLPLARALHFEHPLELEEEAAAQRQRHLCFKLLATWEELAELQEQHLFWTSERLHANPAARLKGLIHAIVGSRRAADGAAPTSDEVSIEIV